MKSTDAVAAFASLAQETRLAVFRRLIKAGPEGVTAGALSEAVGAPASTLSFHLKELSRAGLVHAERDGRSIIYAADHDGVRGLIDYLLSDCCGGDPTLCAPYQAPKPQRLKKSA